MSAEPWSGSFWILCFWAVVAQLEVRAMIRILDSSNKFINTGYEVTDPITLHNPNSTREYKLNSPTRNSVHGGHHLHDIEKKPWSIKMKRESKWQLLENKKVLLRERKRHTARHVASTSVVLSREGYPIPGWWGTPSQDGGYPHPGMGYPCPNPAGGVPHPRTVGGTLGYPPGVNRLKTLLSPSFGCGRY